MCTNLRPALVIGISCSILVVGIACSVLKAPQLPTDIATIESCIQQSMESGVTDPTAIAITCYPGEVQFVVDFITALLKGSWAQAHPALVGPLQAGLKTYSLEHSTDGGMK
jgi:hypothetical protein